MGSYKIQYKRSAEKDLRKINPAQIPAIVESVESLADNPRPPHHRKVKGAQRLYRIRVGDYRVIYHLDAQAKIITIYYIRHRKDAYRRM